MFRPALRSLLSLAPLALLPIAGQAQTQPSFAPHTVATTLPQPGRTIAVDVNNDGLPDIIQDTSQLTSADQYGLHVRLANGDGTFREGYSYSFPAGSQGPFSMQTGDVNGDGKVDLVLTVNGTQQIAAFLGNGDGTFQAPRFETIALPGSEHFGIDKLALADFNHDGKVDLVTEANTEYTGQIVLLPGNGDGSFGAARVVHTPAANFGSSNPTIGDFDSDGNADIAFYDTTNCAPNVCGSQVHVAYGNGDLSFTDTTPFTSAGRFAFSTGDLNGDGRTDIFGVDAPNGSRVVTLYASGARSFTLYTSANPYDSDASLAMADVNGDGQMDLIGWNNANYTPKIIVLAGAGQTGVFTAYAYPLTGIPPTTLNITDPVIGDFNRDTRPDIYVATRSEATGSYETTLVNSTPINNNTTFFTFGCDYPAAEHGIHVCSPSASATSPVIFRITASSLGMLRKIELWVDGKKVAEQHNVWSHYGWFYYSTESFDSGTHNLSVYAADIDNHLERYDFSFTGSASSSSCSAPASASVHVCSPINGYILSSPANVTAAATITGTLARMEVWVDGVKKYSETTSTTLVTAVALNPGYHRFDVYAVNTAGVKWEQTVYATVSSGSTGCAAPGSPGVNVCSPAPNSGVSSPVAVSAQATITGTLARMEVWVDGVKMYTETTSTSLSASIALGAGSHRFDIYAVNTAGAKWEKTVTAMVH